MFLNPQLTGILQQQRNEKLNYVAMKTQCNQNQEVGQEERGKNKNKKCVAALRKVGIVLLQNHNMSHHKQKSSAPHSEHIQKGMVQTFQISSVFINLSEDNEHMDKNRLRISGFSQTLSQSLVGPPRFCVVLVAGELETSSTIYHIVNRWISLDQRAMSINNTIL